MKFLMIGLGSIGQRHLRNIRRVYGDEVEIIAYRVRGLKRTFSDTMQIRDNVSLEEEYNIRSYGFLEEALAQKPDVAFITNPTSLHIPCAIACAKAGCHLFLEKPISDNEDQLDELIEIVKEKKLKVFVGYQNRFHPGIKELKKMLKKEELGKVLSVESVVGERLTTMHTYEDYKETYMARKDMGGGVVTNQMVHELDYLYYLFGAPAGVYAVGGVLGDLGIDVEDVCDAVFFGKDDDRSFPVTVHADFYQYPPSRYIQVVGTKGKVKVDIIGNTLVKTIADVTTEISYDKFQRNDMFIDELKSFIDCINKNTKPAIGLNDGIVSLRLATCIKESMKMGGKKFEFNI